MSIEDRVGKIESRVQNIENQVINHIPHMIDDVRTDVAELSKKIKPLKEKDLKTQGVHEFLNVGLKVIGLIGMFIWTAFQIFDKMNWFGM